MTGRDARQSADPDRPGRRAWTWTPRPAWVWPMPWPQPILPGADAFGSGRCGSRLCCGRRCGCSRRLGRRAPLGGGLGCCGLGGSGLARADGLFRGRLCLVTRGRCLAALRLGVILRAGCRRARCLAFGCWSIGLHARSFSYHVRTALAHLPVPPSHCVTNVSACLSQVLPYAHLLQIPRCRIVSAAVLSVNGCPGARSGARVDHKAPAPLYRSCGMPALPGRAGHPRTHVDRYTSVSLRDHLRQQQESPTTVAAVSHLRGCLDGLA